MAYRVVDLGTKLAGAIDVFLGKGDQYYGKDVHGIKPRECLGIDTKTQYLRDVQKKGYKFRAADLTSMQTLEELPPADYYLAWDFMEHLPSHIHADSVLTAALNKARKGVWLRMPSFEQDKTGEAPLKEMGLRFAWTNWKGHPCHYRVEDVEFTLDSFARRTGRTPSKKIRPGRLVIHDTSDARVVPEEAPVDVTKYDAKEHRAKPKAKFDPPLIVQWDFVIFMPAL